MIFALLLSTTPEERTAASGKIIRAYLFMMMHTAPDMLKMCKICKFKKPFDSNHLNFRTLLFRIQLKIFPQRVLSLVYTCREKSLTKYIKYMQYAHSHAYFFKVLVSVRFYRHKCYNFQGLKM